MKHDTDQDSQSTDNVALSLENTVGGGGSEIKTPDESGDDNPMPPTQIFFHRDYEYKILDKDVGVMWSESGPSGMLVDLYWIGRGWYRWYGEVGLYGHYRALNTEELYSD